MWWPPLVPPTAEKVSLIHHPAGTLAVRSRGAEASSRDVACHPSDGAGAGAQG